MVFLGIAETGGVQLSERKVIFRDFCCAQGFVGALLTQGRGFQRGGVRRVFFF